MQACVTELALGARRAPELAEPPVLLILILLLFPLSSNSYKQRLPNLSKIALKMLQNGFPNGSKIASKSILKPLRAPGRSKRNLKTGFNHLGGQQAPKIEQKKAPSRAPDANRAEKGETTILQDSTQDFNDLSGLRAPSLG